LGVHIPFGGENGLYRSAERLFKTQADTAYTRKKIDGFEFFNQNGTSSWLIL
jgi:hypothetical protein